MGKIFYLDSDAVIHLRVISEAFGYKVDYKDGIITVDVAQGN
ncbi:hypothetical protein [Thermoanaerobacterium saccharolyticum]